MTVLPDEFARLRGARVLVTGAGVSGRALVAPLRDLGVEVVVTDGNADALAATARDLDVATIAPEVATATIGDHARVITSPGWRPDSPVLSAAAGAGVPIWGDVEFAWRLDRAQVYGPTRRWLVVTGTNGKTTTTSMLESILSAAGIAAVACGNIGLPVTDALRSRSPRYDVLAVELSSFQLFWAPSVHPAAGAVLNIAEDHLDWHGGMQGYVDAKAQALTGDVGVLGLDDPVAASLRDRPGIARTVGFRLGVPGEGELGVAGERLVDRAFAVDPSGAGETLAEVADVTPAGPAGLMDALAAAALARSIGVPAGAVRGGLRSYRVGPHRAAPVAEVGGVTYVDDSKATNPHAARTSLLAHPRVVWIAGGLLKGAHVDDLVAEVADRLVAVVLFGRDAGLIADALARHAPDVPVRRIEPGHDERVTPTDSPDAVMARAVRVAAEAATTGDTVLLAPAAASLDMFTDYGHRGRSFAAAVQALADDGPA